jgi:hypothetical protein
MSERRQSVRVPSELRSYIRALDGDDYVDCTVLDLSGTGAKLTVGHAIAEGEPVELHIPARGEVVRATVVWSQDSELGVAFEEVYDAERTAAALQRFAALAE